MKNKPLQRKKRTNKKRREEEKRTQERKDQEKDEVEKLRCELQKSRCELDEVKVRSSSGTYLKPQLSTALLMESVNTIPTTPFDSDVTEAQSFWVRLSLLI